MSRAARRKLRCTGGQTKFNALGCWFHTLHTLLFVWLLGGAGRGGVRCLAPDVPPSSEHAPLYADEPAGAPQDWVPDLEHLVQDKHTPAARLCRRAHTPLAAPCASHLNFATCYAVDLECWFRVWGSGFEGKGWAQG